MASPSDTDMPTGEFRALELAQHVARRGLRTLVTVHSLRTALKLGFSAFAAMVVGHLVMNQSVAPWSPAAAVALLLLASLAGFAADRVQASAEADAAMALRAAATRRLNGKSAGQLQSLPVGGLVVAMQRHPEAVASLAIGHHAATIMMAVGPLAAAAMLVLISWQAAVLLIVLTPVMIIFFALVGGEIRRRADAQERTFGRLAGQFADRIRTLPTVLANHALATEEAKLARRLDAYAAKTMSVLRIAFINAAIIDFFASLSIAILAVFLGLGHLGLVTIPGFSDLELWQSLLILMIAPDYFAPFRRFSEQYHAKAEGHAAAAALDRLLGGEAGTACHRPTLDHMLPVLPARGLVAITGPSGIGKSTLLRRIAGLEPSSEHADHALDASGISWISTDSYIPKGALGQAIAWKVGAVGREEIVEAAGKVGLLDDALLPGGIDKELENGGANLSGGQRLRISVARAILADRTVIGDEPTAKLDQRTAAAVRRALLDMARSRLVVVATHEAELAAAADLTVDLRDAGKVEAAA